MRQISLQEKPKTTGNSSALHNKMLYDSLISFEQTKYCENDPLPSVTSSQHIHAMSLSVSGSAFKQAS